MGFLKRIFGETYKVSLAAMTGDEAMKIVNAYGNAMADRKSAISDVSALPYPKDRIKEAIIRVIKAGSDPKMRECLKVGYIALADWQPGIGNRIGIGEVTADDLADPAKTAECILAKGSDFVEYPAKVAAEAAVLLGELKALAI